MLRDALRDVARSALGRDDELEFLRAELKRTKAELTLESRRAREYLALFERIEAQRDERWSMFQHHSSEHLNAQARLEQGLATARDMLQRALTELNAYRKAENRPLVKSYVDLFAEPVGASVAFREVIEQLKARVSAPIDASAESARISKEIDRLMADIQKTNEVKLNPFGVVAQ